MFKTFEEVVGQEVQMGNSLRANVNGKGTVEIDFTSRKKLTLLNVLFVSEIRKKKLISVDLLDRKGFKFLLSPAKSFFQRMVFLLERVMLVMECTNYLLIKIVLFLLISVVQFLCGIVV